MGIKGLSKAIRRMAPAAVRETQLADYAGRTLAIDACIFMYKFRYIGRPIELFTEQVRTLRDAGVTPLYVFEGAACVAKHAQVLRRRAAKQKAVEAVDVARAQATRTQARALSTLGPDPLGAIVACEAELCKA